MMINRRWIVASLLAALLLAGAACVREAGAPEFSKQETAAQVAEVKSEVAIAKESLAHEGHYACCIKPPCDWCVVKANGCACGSMADAGQPVCPECGMGWKQGRGAIEGLEAKDVKNVMDNL